MDVYLAHGEEDHEGVEPDTDHTQDRVADKFLEFVLLLGIEYEADVQDVLDDHGAEKRDDRSHKIVDMEYFDEEYQKSVVDGTADHRRGFVFDHLYE